MQIIDVAEKGRQEKAFLGYVADTLRRPLQSVYGNMTFPKQLKKNLHRSHIVLLHRQYCDLNLDEDHCRFTLIYDIHTEQPENIFLHTIDACKNLFSLLTSAHIFIILDPSQMQILPGPHSFVITREILLTVSGACMRIKENELDNIRNCARNITIYVDTSNFTSIGVFKKNNNVNLR